MSGLTGNDLFGRVFTRRPACPFCGMHIESPRELDTRRPGEMPVGSCSCGAVYAYDATGHNLGAAFIEALVFGCNMDWDLAWNLYPEEDYLESLVENYDLESHLIVPGGHYEGRRVSGALYFIRLERDIRDIAEPGVQKRLKKAVASPSAAAPAEISHEKKYTKKEIEDLVNNYRVEELTAVAGHDKRIIRDLQRLLYSGDTLLRQRAAEILGRACAVIAGKDPGTVSNLLKKLFNSVVSPGTSSWGSIDAIGEIIANSPDLYAGYIPTLYQLLEDKDYRPSVIKAVGRTAGVRPDLVKKFSFRFLQFLKDPDAAARGHAAWLMGNLGAVEAAGELNDIVNDPAKLDFYTNGEIEEITVGQLAEEALKKIKQNSDSHAT
ncbi:MAG: DVU0298 family protein [Bacillota bacterium]